MDVGFIEIAIIGIIVFSAIIFGGYLFVSIKAEDSNEVALHNLIQSQKRYKEVGRLGKEKPSSEKGEAAILASSTAGELKKAKNLNSLSVENRIYYSRWKITATQFMVLRYAVMGVAVAGLAMILLYPIYITAAFMVPKMIDTVLNRSIAKRYDNFDKDYPDFLMTFASRLKGGMNALTAMQSVVDSFPPQSILRAEILLMIERIRLGYQEDQAIGAFGESIPHPEIELFVQALILNRKIGGNLSGTIERLATQVRKRQEFRKKAVSSVAEQRGGALIVFVIMLGLILAILVGSPELFEAVKDSKTAMTAFQGGFSISIWGFWLVRYITNIKI